MRVNARVAQELRLFRNKFAARRVEALAIFDTPFFWWQHLTGIIDGSNGLIGFVGPTKRHWGFAVEPVRDTFDLLSAVAFMHWKWWRW